MDVNISGNMVVISDFVGKTIIISREDAETLAFLINATIQDEDETSSDRTEKALRW